MLDLYNRVKDLSKSKGLSLNGLAKKAKITPSTFYDLKSGRIQDFSRKTAEKIATALEISVDELYGKTEKPPDAEASRAKKHEEFIEILETLPEEKQQAVLDYLRYVAGK